MKTLAFACLIVALTVPCAVADTSVSVRAGSSGFEFGFLYSDHYHTEEAVVQKATAHCDETDFIVALHLAQVSGIDLQIILGWRQKEMSWNDITHKCDQHADIYYVDLGSDPGPPYGRAVGHWKKNRGKDIVLSDEEIRAFAVLRAMSEYTGQSASQILAERKQGRRPVDIATSARKNKPGRVEDASSPVPTKSSAKQSGKHQGKGTKKK
jgi:hypothetical protein